MISEFQELSNKIDQLAEMTHGLRRENAWLRQSNTALVADNIEYQRRLLEAHVRVEALLEKIPPLVADAAAAAAPAPATAPVAQASGPAMAEPHAAPMPVDGGMQ